MDGSRFPASRASRSASSAIRSAVSPSATKWRRSIPRSIFWPASYQPSKSLCLLTFDDGLKDHYRDVYPILQDAGVQGLFFLTSRCLDGHVLAVHKNHHLMAGLDFAAYRDAFMSRLDSTALSAADQELAARAYPWDSVDVGQFKYLLDYRLARERRDAILDALFEEFIGDERAFANELYLTATEAREMQAGGMVMGGHSHEHTPLSSLDESAQRADLIDLRHAPQGRAVPPGALAVFIPVPILRTRSPSNACATAGFSCSFALDGGDNRPRHDLFRVRRIDTKDLVF